MSEHCAHWMETADRVYDGPWIGECDNGDLWVLSRNPFARMPSWGRWKRFNRRNPLHWLTYWRSRRARKVVWLERAS